MKFFRVLENCTRLVSLQGSYLNAPEDNFDDVSKPTNLTEFDYFLTDDANIQRFNSLNLPMLKQLNLFCFRNILGGRIPSLSKYFAALTSLTLNVLAPQLKYS